MPQCALCLHDRELRQSHIIPAFAVRHLKETSATGYVRGAGTPNLRQQDLETVALLCAGCEQVFSSWEREFSQSAFPKVQSDNFREVQYDDWLLKFAVSLNWRVLVCDKEDLLQEYPQFARHVEKTLEQWRRFLLGSAKQPGTEHHLFVFGVPTKVPDDAHKKLVHYMLRAIDASVMVSNKHIGVYAKLLRSFFYSPVVPVSASGWKNTRIHAGIGRLVSPQKIAMPGFGEFLNSRVAEAFSKPLSEVQLQKIAKAIINNPDRSLRSESYKAHKATRSLFGVEQEHKDE
jgi:hypothetical protein